MMASEEDDFDLSNSLPSEISKWIPKIIYTSESDISDVESDSDVEDISDVESDDKVEGDGEDTIDHILPQSNTNKQSWDSVTMDYTSFKEYDQEYELLSKTDCNDPFAIYKLFLTDHIVDYMVSQTNKYAEKCIAEHPLSVSGKHEQAWTAVTREDMNTFIGILLIMGVVHVPEIRLYWSEDTMYTNLLIKRSMARDRFLNILKYWHFSDDSQICSENHLHKISYIVEKINESFQKAVKPGKEVVINESMVPWRGWLKFRQDIPNKCHKYSIKLYKLCLPQGYTYRVNICSGKKVNTINKGHAHKVVMELMSDLLYKGHILYTDSFYTTIPLARELLEKKTFLCGTVRSNRAFLPDEAKKKQTKGDITSVQKEGIKFMKWTDKRPVLMLTTCKNHLCSLTETKGQRTVQKPDVVLSYNSAKKGVNLSDQMSAYYTTLRKTIKWHRKIILELICGTMLVNAWCLHTKFGVGKKLSILEFRKYIIDNLLTKKESVTPVSPKNKIHILKKYEGLVRATRKRCKECYVSICREEGREKAVKKSKKVNTYCPLCENQPTLCFKCFEKIHN